MTRLEPVSDREGSSSRADSQVVAAVDAPAARPGAGARRRSVRVSAAFALVFVVAVLLGRRTVMDGTSLSLVWPAAGVAAAWFAVQRDHGTRLLDTALLALVTWTLNVATGTGPLLALFFVAANLVQAEVFVRLLRRWSPGLWGSGGGDALTGTRTLARVLAAAVVATSAGALVGPTAAALDTGRWSWLVVAVWLVRNSVSILLITVMVLRVGHALAVRSRASGGDRPDAHVRRLPFLVPSGWQAVELAAAVVGSVAAYAAVFWFAHGLPLAFVPLSLTVWVALRFDTTLVSIHDVLVSALAVVLTLAGGGPFALIPTDATRALVVQVYVGLLAVIGLMLAVSRDEREVLVLRLRRSETTARELLDQARLRAEFVDTVLATVDVGVAVCDAEGRLTLLNDTARTWAGADPAAALVEVADLDGRLSVLRAEGSPLGRALHEGRVEGVELLISPPDRPPVPVTCSARRMVAEDGTLLGAVVAMHDLRTLRSRESALADANERLREHGDHLERVTQVSRAVLTSEEPRRAVCEAALEISEAVSVTLWQPDLVARRFVATAAATAGVSHDADGPPVAADLDLDTGSSLVNACYRQNRAVFLADATRHPLANPLIAETLGHDASGVWLPVPGREGNVAGVLVVLWASRVAVLPPGTSALLTALAAEAAHAFDRADLVAQLARAAVHDPLTGLANRRRWDEVAALEIARATRTDTPLTFALVDLDHFKAYNDARGHLEGDELLREFARRAPAHLRDLDVLARWGGEEFALALPGCTAEQARLVADRIRGDVPDGQTCSIGVSQWEPGQDAVQVMAAADEALYRAKHQGRDQTVLAPGRGRPAALTA